MFSHSLEKQDNNPTSIKDLVFGLSTEILIILHLVDRVKTTIHRVRLRIWLMLHQLWLDKQSIICVKRTHDRIKH